MPVQTLTSLDPSQFFNLRSPSDVGGYRLDTRVGGLAVSNDFSGRFSVTTAEGDTITLTADVETDVQAGTYQSRLVADTTATNVGVGYTRYALQRDFSLTVHGDLNDQETQDLDALFQKISGIFRGFFQGQDESAQAQSSSLAEGFGRLTTLSTLDLSVEVVRSVAVAAASHGTPGGAPGAAAVTPRSSTGTTAPTPSSDSSDDTYFNVPTKDGQIVSLVQQILDALQETKVELEKIRKHLPDFLDKLHEELAEELRNKRGPKADDQNRSGVQQSGEGELFPTSHALLASYQTVTESSLSLSLQV